MTLGENIEWLQSKANDCGELAQEHMDAGDSAECTRLMKLADKYEQSAEYLKKYEKTEARDMAGQKLNELMLKRGMTCNDLAREVGISAATISRYTANKTVPKANTLGKIAKALNVPVEYLLQENKNKIDDYCNEIIERIDELSLAKLKELSYAIQVEIDAIKQEVQHG